MATDIVHAKVARPRYVYRGTPLPFGTIVRMSRALFESTQRHVPPDFVLATEQEVRRAHRIIDLVDVAPKNTVGPDGERQDLRDAQARRERE